MTRPDLPQLFARIPALASRPFTDWQLSPLPGLTNRSQKVWHPEGGEAYVLRLPGPAADAYLSRRREQINAGRAAALGLTPPTLWADPGQGVMLLPFLADSRMLTSEDLGDPQIAADLGRLLARLHRSGVHFDGTIDAFAAIDGYRRLGTTPVLEALRRAAEPLRLALAARPLPLVPSHIDANPANILRHDDGRLTLIDWEFSSEADPAWDLATVMIEGVAGTDGQAALLAGYGRADDRDFADRIAVMALVLHLVAASWAVAEIALGNDHPAIAALIDHHRQALDDGLAAASLTDCLTRLKA